MNMSICGLMTCAAAAVALLVVANVRAAEPELVGHWEGTMVSHNQSIPVVFDFTRGAHDLEGRFTSLTQAAMDYPLDKVALDRTHVTLKLGGSMAFDGALNADTTADTIADTFKNDEMSGAFSLRRAVPPELPYAVDDVSFRNGDGVLAGSLCLPRTPGPHAAVVLLHGSGPESRWGTNRYIADRFARTGIATLIYDKRGSRISAGDWRTASYDDLARDALAGVKLLASRADIDRARIGLHGHSQGGAIAPLAATLAPNQIAFIVAEDTFAGPQKDQDIYRVRTALPELNLSPADFHDAMKIYTLFVDAARGARTYADFDKASSAYRSTQWYKWMQFPPRDSWIWPWALKNANFDTILAWRDVHVPVLLVYGEKDALVPVDASIARIGAALDAEKTPYSALIAPAAQRNLTIQPEPAAPFFWWHQAPGLIDTVVAWVAYQMRVPPAAK
jgi:uncharacterized protein